MPKQKQQDKQKPGDGAKQKKPEEKQKPDATGEKQTPDEGQYDIDWKKQARRPFKRGFIGYGNTEDPAETTKRRKLLGLSITEDPSGEESTPSPLEGFEELGVLPPWLVEALHEDNCFEPPPVQAQALPVSLAGQNLVVIAPAPNTTDGATVAPGGGQPGAYLIPAAVHIDDQPPLAEDDAGPVVVVLTATQELAASAVEAATSLFRHSSRSTRHRGGVRCVSVSGGGTRSEKLKELTSRGAHIITGTPKRVHDMAMKEQISLLRVTMLVLDGADKMLEHGAEAEIKQLSEWVRPERQTTIVAATWPKTLSDLARDLCFAGGLPVRFRAQKPPPGKIAATAKAGAGAKKLADKSAVDAKKLPGKRVVDTTDDGEDAAAEPAEEPPPELAIEAKAEEFPEDW